MRPSRLVRAIATFGFLLASEAHGESLTGTLGYGTTNIVSTEYKPKSINSTQLAAAFSHVLLGRWSLMAQYQADTSNVMQGFSGGVIYDTAQLEAHGGLVNLDGKPELIRIPKWWIRAMAGAGMWQVSDTLELNNPYLGSKNKTPVQASIYGLTFGVGLFRFVSDGLAVHTTVSSAFATTGQFAMSSSSIGFGVFWKYD